MFFGVCMKLVHLFNNWVHPSDDILQREYKVEYVLKGMGQRFGDPFPTAKDFLRACHQGEIVEITPQMDSSISNRSHTRTKEQLLDLIRSYRSYPEFRNEKTLDDLYNGFENNRSMELPIVLKDAEGRYRVFSGNTRMDVAFQLGINPHVLVVNI